MSTIQSDDENAPIALPASRIALQSCSATCSVAHELQASVLTRVFDATAAALPRPGIRLIDGVGASIVGADYRYASPRRAPLR
jgi:hypothetical protein